MPASPIIPKQNRAIEALMQRNQIDRASYYQLLRTQYNAESKKELTFEQANDLIVRMGGKAIARAVPHTGSKRQPGEQRIQYATSGQLARLRYHAYACAVHYAALPAYSFDGKILRGEELRQELKRRFQLNRMVDPPPPESMRIPATLIRTLYETWINPTSNKYLVEGGFKRSIRQGKENILFYDRLSTEAVSYLIQRYRQMHVRIADQYTVL